jgi:DNA anti-recombination protein RmuC
VTTTQQPDEPMWAAFQDVVKQITGPVADAAVDRVAEESRSLEGAIAKLTMTVSNLSAQHEDATRRARRQATQQAEDIQALAASIDLARTELTAAVEQARTSLSADTDRRITVLATELSERLTAELATVSTRLHQWERTAASYAEESRAARTDLATTLTAALKETAARIEERDRRLHTTLDTMSTTLGTSVGTDIQTLGTKTEALHTRLTSVQRLTRITAALSLAVAAAACVIATLR